MCFEKESSIPACKHLPLSTDVKRRWRRNKEEAQWVLPIVAAVDSCVWRDQVARCALICSLLTSGELCLRREWAAHHNACRCLRAFLKAPVHHKSQTVCILARKADTNNASAAVVHLAVPICSPDHNFRRRYFPCFSFDSSNYVFTSKMKVQVEVRSDFILDCHQRRTSCDLQTILQRKFFSNIIFTTGSIWL